MKKSSGLSLIKFDIVLFPRLNLRSIETKKKYCACCVQNLLNADCGIKMNWPVNA